MLQFLQTAWPIVAAFAGGALAGATVAFVAAVSFRDDSKNEEIAGDDLAFDQDVPPHPFPAPIAPEPAFNGRPGKAAEAAEAIAFEGEVIILPMRPGRPSRVVRRFETP